MLLLTEPTLFYWNLLNDFTSDLKQAYTGGVMTWAQKVYKINLKKNTHSMKTPKNLMMSQCTSSTALSQLTRATTAASSATPPPGTPTSLVLGDNFSEGCFPDEEDHPERMAAYALVGMRKPSGLWNVVAPVEYFA